MTIFSIFSTPALALSCLWGVESVNTNQQLDVPTNAVAVAIVAGMDPDLLDVVLKTDPDSPGIELPRDQDLTTGIRLPLGDLEPDTPYILEFSDDDTPQGSYEFTTGAGPDDVAPDAPVGVTSQYVRDSSEWGETEGVRVEIATIRPGEHFEMQLGHDGDYEDSETIVSLGSRLIGRGLCSSSLPDFDKQGDETVRVRSVDLAGNVSEWVEVRPRAAIGCSAIPAGGSGFLALLAFLGLSRRRC